MPENKQGNEYILLKLLGSGGYADVYKAKHTVLGYIRAIRILRQLVLSEDNAVYKKFLRECKVLLRLGNGCHPNIVHIYQPRLVDGHPLVEMDYVDGVDLKEYIVAQGGEVLIDEVVRMAKEIGSALAYCHRDIYKVCYDRDEDDLMDDPNDGEKVLIDDATERRLIEKYRVIHNDIQTRNIMRRNGDGMYVLLDFGLAIDGNGDVVGSSRMSKGAPEFKPPEKWDDDFPTTQGDIYSFGCVLYAMLTGHPPFPLEVTGGHISMSSLNDLCNKHKRTPPAPIERPDVPRWLLRVVERCLEKDPANRYADGYEMYQDICEGIASEKKASPAPQPIVPSASEADQLPYVIPEDGDEEDENLEVMSVHPFESVSQQEVEHYQRECDRYQQECERYRSRSTLFAILMGVALLVGMIIGIVLKGEVL